jgi:redox-sensitive bicupin YhaK (pirin superfamily)
MQPPSKMEMSAMSAGTGIQHSEFNPNADLKPSHYKFDFSKQT